MTWTAPETDRQDPSGIAGERAMLWHWLDYHRQTLLHKCAGLTGEQLAWRSVAPSTLSLLGLVRHMTEVERAWFRIRATGADLGYLYCTDDNMDGDFDDVDAADAAIDFAVHRTELDLCDKAVADLALDHTFTHPRHGELTLRWVYMHVIEEYARHNGHADLLRERIDGTTGD